MKKYFPLAAVCGLLFILMLANTYSSKKRKSERRYLPIFGNKYVQNNDTIFHTIADFSFINQAGRTISQKDTEGKNYVAEYFFANCESICPIMNTNMELVAQAFKADTTFRILSHTVKPDEDSVTALLKYSLKYNADEKIWWFLTGDKKELYSLARKSYLMNNEEGNGDADDFIHTQLFALVDKQKRIRGYYDGTDEQSVKRLIEDVKILKKEQAENEATAEQMP